MAKHSKNYLAALKQYDPKKSYDLTEAVALIKKLNYAKFDASVDVVFNLNLDVRHADQQLRGAIALPAGSGKKMRILALTTTQAAAAKNAKADYVGDDNYIQKIQKENWFDFDIIVATPDIMPKLAALGRVLGPKGLMPNPKVGTVTTDIEATIKSIQKGKANYRTDKTGNVHVPIGKTSFTPEQLQENLDTIIKTIKRVRPASVKGKYIKSITLSSTMSPGIKITIPN